MDCSHEYAERGSGKQETYIIVGSQLVEIRPVEPLDAREPIMLRGHGL